MAPYRTQTSRVHRREFLASLALSPPLNKGLKGARGRDLQPAGEWWQYRGDRRLSGRSAVRGSLRTPRVAWIHPLRGTETLLRSPVPGMPRSPAPPHPGRKSWEATLQEWRVPGQYGTSWVDLDGDGKLVPVTRHYNEKVGAILPGVRGLQRIVTEPLGYPQVPNVYRGTVRLETRERGKWTTRWKTETPTLIWQAQPIFGDFDGDGRVEIAALPWYRLTHLDADSGAIRESCNYLAEDESELPGMGGRAYGWFGALDVDGDGKSEFVILEDFIRYATVLKRVDGRLRRLWLRTWDAPLARGVTRSAESAVVVRVGPEPVQDIDGDGRRELLLSVYNHTGDGRWHVVALDSATGETILDLPGEFLHGLHDVDGDGVSELWCSATRQGPLIPDPSRLSLYSARGRTAHRVWGLPEAAFAVSPVEELPPHVNTGAALGTETVLFRTLDGHGVFFTSSPEAGTSANARVTCWVAAPGKQPEVAGEWSGPGLEPLAVRGGREAGVLLRCAAREMSDGPLPGTRGASDALPLCSRPVPAPLAPVVVGRPAPGKPPLLIAQGAQETVVAFRPPPSRPARARSPGEGVTVWRLPGRGMTCNNYFEGLLLADLDGNGHLAAVLAGRGQAGCARLVVVDAATGQRRWQRDFPEFPGAPPPWNVPGLMYWQAGCFRHAARMDLLIQLRRVGGESVMLDGRTGEPVWRQDRGRPGRDFGRWWFAIVDADGDGLEDVLNFYPDMFCIARGTDGRLLIAEESRRYVGIAAYYADVLVADFLRRGTPQVLYCHEHVTALLTLTGELVWKQEHPHPHGWRNGAGYGDVHGAGTLSLFFPGAAGGRGPELQVRAAATGALEWSLPLPEPATAFPTVADVDGDGRDECLFALGSTLYAAGSRRQGEGGEIRWRHGFPARIGPVTFADTRGTGRGEIVVLCEDGNVYALG